MTGEQQKQAPGAAVRRFFLQDRAGKPPTTSAGLLSRPRVPREIVPLGGEWDIPGTSGSIGLHRRRRPTWLFEVEPRPTAAAPNRKLPHLSWAGLRSHGAAVPLSLSSGRSILSGYAIDTACAVHRSDAFRSAMFNMTTTLRFARDYLPPPRAASVGQAPMSVRRIAEATTARLDGHFSRHVRRHAQ